MQKVAVSHEQIEKIVRLRKNGGKWLQIAKEMNLGRAIIKREYEEWENNQSLGDLKEARRDVAAEAFREHVNLLIQVAGMLTKRKRVPTVSDSELTANEFRDQIWGTDSLRQKSGYSEFNLRQNNMLFESLKTHTKDIVQWKDWDEWWKEWNGCIGYIDSLRKEALKMIDSFLTREESAYPSLTANIKKHAQPEPPLEQMAGAIILELLWRLERNESELIRSVTKVHSHGNERQLLLASASRYVLKFRDSDMVLAKAADRACNSVAKELFKIRQKDSIEPLRESTIKIRKLSERFEELLDPLMLRPMILRTRCELCPA